MGSLFLKILKNRVHHLSESPVRLIFHNIPDPEWVFFVQSLSLLLSFQPNSSYYCLYGNKSQSALVHSIHWPRTQRREKPKPHEVQPRLVSAPPQPAVILSGPAPIPSPGLRSGSGCTAPRHTHKQVAHPAGSPRVATDRKTGLLPMRPKQLSYERCLSPSEWNKAERAGRSVFNENLYKLYSSRHSPRQLGNPHWRQQGSLASRWPWKTQTVLLNQECPFFLPQILKIATFKFSSEIILPEKCVMAIMA